MTDTTSQGNVTTNLTDLYEGQYVTVSSQVMQVQSTNVDDSYDLVPVDLDNIILDLSNDYDLLQVLIAQATAKATDLSGLIIDWLRSYPDVQKQLTEQNTQINSLQTRVHDLTASKTELEQEVNTLQVDKTQLASDKSRLEKEISDLQAKLQEQSNEPSSAESGTQSEPTGQNLQSRSEAGTGTISQGNSSEAAKEDPNPSQSQTNP